MAIPQPPSLDADVLRSRVENFIERFESKPDEA
jgi:hypothetical protein